MITKDFILEEIKKYTEAKQQHVLSAQEHGKQIMACEGALHAMNGTLKKLEEIENGSTEG
jgi:hypothetical protein